MICFCNFLFEKKEKYDANVCFLKYKIYICEINFTKIHKKYL